MKRLCNFDFMKHAKILIAVALLTGCLHRPGLIVTHTPNPTGRHDASIPEGKPFPYMWFYRTEVRNTTDFPIQITRFEGLFLKEAKWTPSNVLKRPLTAEDFAQWYRDGKPASKGWINPHTSAVCDPNWHGTPTPISPRCKWTFEGRDAKGKTYHAEAEIKSLPAPGATQED